MIKEINTNPFNKQFLQYDRIGMINHFYDIIFSITYLFDTGKKNTGKLQVVAVKLAILVYFCPIQKVKIRQ